MEILDGLFRGEDKRGFVALHCPLPTPDLSEWGWTLLGHPPLQLRSPFTPLHDTQGIRVEQVVDPATLEIFEHILIEGFELDEMQDSAGCPRFSSTATGCALRRLARLSRWSARGSRG